MLPDKDELNYTKRGIIAMIDVAMGGRAAEDIFFGDDEISSGKKKNIINKIVGCSNDLAKATELAYMYVK